MCFDLGTWANVVTAIFTALTAISTEVAAGAAWRAASVALRESGNDRLAFFQAAEQATK